ncbi:MAG: hypothetical protein IH969_04830 [Candidatus Krumholzibacteriota bacterium]|nr:hypothetical protein [Candidatus Krumholzibacteriota bacterium]
MSRFILCLFLTLLLAATTLGWPATSRSDPSENEVPTNYPEEVGLWVSISTTSGNPPLAVRVAGVGQSGYTATAAYVEFDGTEYLAVEMWGVNFDFTYVFACPGTFEVRAWITPGTSYLHTWTVEVTGEPGAANYTIVPHVGSLRGHVEYIGLEGRESIIRPTMDWGDGSGEQDVVFFDTPHLRSQFYYFTSPGEFTLTTRNYYGDTACDPVAVTATWTSPIVVLPVEATTWGRVKALYK